MSYADRFCFGLIVSRIYRGIKMGSTPTIFNFKSDFFLLIILSDFTYKCTCVALIVFKIKGFKLIFFIEFFWKFLSEMFQQMCISYLLPLERWTRRQKRINAQIFVFLSPILTTLQFKDPMWILMKRCFSKSRLFFNTKTE